MVELCCTSGAGSGDATSYTSDEKPRRFWCVLIISHDVKAISSQESAAPASLTLAVIPNFHTSDGFCPFEAAMNGEKFHGFRVNCPYQRYDVAMATPSKAVGRCRFMSDVQAVIRIPMEIPRRGCQCQGFM